MSDENLITESEVIVDHAVRLADGTILVADAGYANGDLWIWIRNLEKTFVEYAVIFSDPEKTKIIQYVWPRMKIEENYEGFTRLTTITVNDDGQISIRMRKP